MASGTSKALQLLIMTELQLLFGAALGVLLTQCGQLRHHTPSGALVV